MSDTLKGGCNCQHITYVIETISGKLFNCHCTICQKASASAFIPWAITDIKYFRWITGEDRIKSFQSSPDFKRNFCPDCGSQLPVIDEKHQKAYIPAGTIDPPFNKPVDGHWYIRSRPDWHKIGDDAPQHQTVPE